jgi:glycosyltransferase involved in cell wall biosynthesis
LKEKPLEDLPEETEGWKYKVFGPRKFWTQLALPLNLYWDRPRPDVFFTPTHYAPRFCPVPSVVSIMDLSFLKFPKMFRKRDLAQLKSWTAYSVKKAIRVLTISQASKSDIISHYQVPEEKVVVTYPGTKIDTKILRYKDTKVNSEQLKAKYGIEGDYILYVGTLQPRKNLIRLIEAFKKLKTQNSKLKSKTKNLRLVICGKKGWLYDKIFREVKDLNLEKEVIFTGFVPDQDLPALYKGAKCFVLVSLYEGFGIPVLEALSFGCPVVISNISSLPEVGGEVVIKVDPESVVDIARGITEVLGLSRQERQKLIEQGKKQAQKFSWEKCARETLRVLEEAAGLKS